MTPLGVDLGEEAEGAGRQARVEATAGVAGSGRQTRVEVTAGAEGAGRQARVEVTAGVEAGEGVQLADWLAARLEEALTALGIDDCALTVVLTDDDALHRLNRDYRNVDAATDVLSFAAAPEATEPGERRYLGDVLISVEHAWKQADAGGHSLADELALLGVHGLLHLLGHDDESEEGRTAMEDLERTLGVR